MRRVFLGMMVSLDGCFEGPNHDLSWHNVDDDFQKFVAEQNSQIGTILFGRKTYEMMASFWPTPQALAVDPATAKFMNETTKVVVSHAPFKPEWSNSTVITENIPGEIRKLKAQPGKTSPSSAATI